MLVDDAVDVVDVDAAGGNVRGDEDGELAVFEGAHGLFTLLLRDIAVDAVGVEAHADQIVAQTLAHDLRVAEDDGSLEPQRADEAADHVDLLERRAGDGILRDVRAVVGVGGDGDLHLVALVHPRDRHDLLRDGGREQAEIAAVFDLLDDLCHVVKEAHVEHPVRLVVGTMKYQSFLNHL